MTTLEYQIDPQLKALTDAARTITAELSLEQVLYKIAEVARELINARYAALGIHDGRGTLSQFITTGVDQETADRIGSLPEGHSLLGAFLHHGKALIVNDISKHPASAGFPPHHPIMRSLLGVPIFSKDRLIGALYLADKQDGTNFTHADQQLIEMLAGYAAIAIENARLYEKTQRLAILEERERFSRDLHDGIIQSIYAVGLALESAKTLISPDNQEALTLIDSSMKSLANVITDIRNYIFDLRPQALRDKGLYARLEGLLKELKVNTILNIEAHIDPDINDYLNDTQSSHIFHITHEALSNVARHAKARKVNLSLTHQDGYIKLVVQDDGIGFTVPRHIVPGHRGLANIKKRAAQLGASLSIQSDPVNGGTCLTLRLKKSTRQVVRPAHH
ncbi:MAG: GAF domain-containing protein [Chloroflexi bacterium]|nr:MAG: GAF domain-containing protein [Chloroflexota bacterium]